MLECILDILVTALWYVRGAGMCDPPSFWVLQKPCAVSYIAAESNEYSCLDIRAFVV